MASGMEKLIPDPPVVPVEMLEAPNWVLWTWDLSKKSRLTKAPRQSNGRYAQPDKPRTWGKFNELWNALNKAPLPQTPQVEPKENKHFNGIGFMLSTPFVGIDFDHVLDKDGSIKDEYQWISNYTDSYIEVSPSGDGLHVFGFGSIPSSNRNAKTGSKLTNLPDGALIEIYDSGRYITFTGDTWGSSHPQLSDASALIAEVFRRYKKTGTPVAPTEGGDAISQNSDVLGAMFAGKGGRELERLYNGDMSEFANADGVVDHSSADIRLCNALAYYTGKDASQMDRLFRDSGLMRSKWDEKRGLKTYGEMTIERAIASTNDTWKPGYNKLARRNAASNSLAPNSSCFGRNVTIPTVVEAIQQTPLYNALGYDAMAGMPYVNGVLPWVGKEEHRPFNSRDEAEAFAYIQSLYGYLPKSTFVDALTVVFSRNSYDPLMNEVAMLPTWDGVNRVGNMIQWYLGADDTEFNHEVEKLFYRAGVRRITEPGSKFDTVLVLSGGQGIGKSTFSMKFAINPRFFTDGIDLRAVRDKDTSELVASSQVVELAELSGLSGADMESVKSWVTRLSDDFRPAYGRHKEVHPRRCIFIGTTNENSFLTDNTGNRRFLTVRCGATNPTKNLFDSTASNEFLQAWSEAFYKFNGDESSLTMPAHLHSEIAKAERQATLDDPRIGRIEQYLETKIATCPYPRVCVPELISKALDLDNKDAQGKWLGREIHNIMRTHFADWKPNENRKTFNNWGKQTPYEYRPGQQ